MYNPEQYSRAMRKAVLAEDMQAAEKLSLLYQGELRRQGVEPSEARDMVFTELNRAAEARKRGVLGNFTQGLASGAVGMTEQAALGIAALAEEEDELKYRKAIKEAADFVGPDNVNEESIVSNFGSALGSTVPLIAMSAFGPAGIAAAGATGAAAASGEASERARAANATEEQRNTATLQALGLGASEALVPAKLGGLISKLFKKGAVDKDIANMATDKLSRAKRIGGTAGAEAIQEATVAVGQNLIERGYNPEKEIIDAAVGEEGAYGGAVGATLQGVLELFIPGRNRAPNGRPAAETNRNEMSDEQVEAVETGETPVSDDIAAAAEEVNEDSPLASDSAEAEAVLGPESQQTTQEETPPAGLAGLAAQMQERKEVDEDGQFALDRALFKKDERSIPQPETLDPEQEQRREQERAETDSRNEMLLSGEQQDMFAREKGQDTAGLMRRRGEQARQQEEIDLLMQQQEADAQRRSPDADYQQELDLEGLAQQPDKGQMELFPEDPMSAQPPITREPKPVQTEVPDSQGTLDFDGTQQAQREREEAQAREEATQFTDEVVQTRQQQRTQARRDKIIEDVISTSSPDSTPNRIRRKVVAEMRRQKLRDAKVTKPEMEKINRALETVNTLSQASTSVQRPAKSKKTSTTPKMNKADLRRQEKQQQAAPNLSQVKGPQLSDEKLNIAEEVRTNNPNAKPEQLEALFKEQLRKRGVKSPTVRVKDRKALQGDGRQAAEKLVPAKKPAVKAEEKPDAAKSDSSKRTTSAKPATAKKPSTAKPKPTAKKTAPKSEPVEGKNKENVDKSKRSGKANEKVEEIKDTPPKDGEAESFVPRDAKGKELTKEEAEKRIGNVLDNMLTFMDSPKKLQATLTRLGMPKDQVDRLMTNLIGENSLPLEEVAMTAETAPFAVRSSLVGNRLAEGMERLAKALPNGRLKRVAQLVGKNAGSTRVVVMKNLTASDGRPVAGYFDPQENAIYLDANDGMNIHTILHEGVHALASAGIANKSSALSKQLNKLYEDVKDKLGTAYGTKNVDEFLSEAMSNPAFQDKLARVRPDGSEISAFRQFVNSIIDFVRSKLGMSPSKKSRNALDEADRLFMSLAHPAPVTRMAGEFYMESDQTGAANIASNFTGANTEVWSVTQNLPPKAKYIDNFAKTMQGQPIKLRRPMLSLFHMQTIADYANQTALGKLGYKALQTMNKQRGAMETMDNRLTKMLTDINKRLEALPQEVRKALNDMVYDTEFGATIVQVDPSILDSNKREDKAKVREYEKDPEKAAAIEPLKAQWKALDDDAKKIYTDTQEAYNKLYEELIQTANKRIESSVDKENDSKESQSKRKDLYEKLLENSKLDVYFPLVREGEYTLRFEYKTNSGAYEPAVMQYSTIAEREEAKKIFSNRLTIKPNSWQEGNRSMQKYDRNNIPATSFVGDVISTLNANNVDDSVVDQILKMFVDSLPESAFAKSLQGRQGIAGYVQDVGYALNNKAFNLGNQIVRMQYSNELSSVSKEISDKVKDETEKNGKTKALDDMSVIADELNDRINFAMNGAKDKNTETVVRVANQFAFNWTIGLNVASALVNLSQVPLIMYPVLGGRFGWKKSDKAIRSASRLVYGSSRFAADKGRTGNALEKASIASGIDNYFDITYLEGKDREKGKDFTLKLKDNVPDELKDQLEGVQRLVEKAKEQGQLSTSYMLEALGLQEVQKKGREGFQGGMDKLTNVMAGMFNQAERFNRQVAMVSSYNLRLEELKAEKGNGKTLEQMKDEAADYAIYTSQELNGGVTVETGSRLGREGILRMAMMYKSYGVAMYTMMFKKAKQALKQYKNKDERRSARNQIIGIFGSSLLFSGVYGMPIYGSVAMVYDLLLADDDEEEFNSVVEAAVGTGLFRGALNPALEMVGLDIDVGSRMRLTDLLFQDSRFNPDASPEQLLGQHMGGVAISVGSKVSRGVNDILEGRFLRGMEGILPTAVSNAIKPIRVMSEDGYRTRRRDLVVGDITLGELLGQALGFGPERYIRQQEENRRVKNISEGINKRVTDATRKYYLGMYYGDWDLVDEAMETIDEFNEEHPRYAITQKKLDNSLKGQIRVTEQGMFNGVSLDKTTREAMREYNDNTIGILFDL